MQRNLLRRRQQAGWSPLPLCVDKKLDPTSNSLGEAQRCYAPEEY
jgi:hypothetical protein